MSKQSLFDKLGTPEPARGTSVAEDLGLKVGNLQMMMQAIKSAPRGKESELLQALFGLDPQKADHVVSLLKRKESEKGGYRTIAEQIRDKNGKTAQENAAEHRARGQKVSHAMAKVIKKAASIADRMTEEDREAGMQVLRDALVATTPYFNQETKTVEERIDLRTRMAALTLQLAYDEGLPVQRVLTGRVEQETAEETMARLRESPEAMRAIMGLKAVGIGLALGGEVIDVEATVLPNEEEKPD